MHVCVECRDRPRDVQWAVEAVGHAVGEVVLADGPGGLLGATATAAAAATAAATTAATTAVTIIITSAAAGATVVAWGGCRYCHCR